MFSTFSALFSVLGSRPLGTVLWFPVGFGLWKSWTNLRMAGEKGQGISSLPSLLGPNSGWCSVPLQHFYKTASPLWLSLPWPLITSLLSLSPSNLGVIMASHCFKSWLPLYTSFIFLTLPTVLFKSPADVLGSAAPILKASWVSSICRQKILLSNFSKYVYLYVIYCSIAINTSILGSLKQHTSTISEFLCVWNLDVA